MTRRIWALLAINAALVAALVWSPSRTDERAPIAFTLPELSAVTGVTINRTGQPEVRLIRLKDAWRVAPANAPADPYAIEALEDAFATVIGMDQVIELEPTGPTDEASAADTAGSPALDDFGLGPHASRVIFTLRDGGQLAFAVGKVVDGRRTFIQPAETELVYRARANLRQVFDRPARNWRERRLFGRTPNEVARLRAERSGQVIWAAERAAADAPWRLTTPTGIEPGQNEITAVANTLATVQVDGFEDAPDTPWKPTAQLVAETFEGQRFGLAFESPGPDGRLRAKAIAGGPIGSIPRHLAVFLDARASDLRERRVWVIPLAEVTSIAIAGAPVMRVSRGASDGWQMDAPPPTGPLPADRVEGWLMGLLELRAAGFVDRPPADAFDTLVHRVDLQLSDKRQVGLEIGSAYGNGAHHARTTDRTERVFVVGPAAMRALRPDPRVFRAPTEPSAP